MRSYHEYNKSEKRGHNFMNGIVANDIILMMACLKSK